MVSIASSQRRKPPYLSLLLHLVSHKAFLAIVGFTVAVRGLYFQRDPSLGAATTGSGADAAATVRGAVAPSTGNGADEKCEVFRKGHLDRKVNSEAFLSASSISDKHGYVMLQMFNHGYANMTKSWICNVRKFDGVLEKTLFVATDRAGYDAIKSFDADLNVALEVYTAPAVLTYGQLDYYAYMLFRSNFLVSLLDRNVTTWLVESDAVWLDDPTGAVLGMEGDTVTMNDDERGAEIKGNGGFQLLRPTLATRNAWHTLKSEQHDMITTLCEGKEANVLKGNEQHMMDRLRKDLKDEFKTGWLPVQHFVSGAYFIMKNKPKSPVVILNNWIKGNDAKVQRAKKWGHWFLGENDACMSDEQRRAAANISKEFLF